MSGQIDITTLLFLVVALVLFVKLRSLLGRRTGDEEARYRSQKAQRAAAEAQAAANEKVVALPRRPREDGPAPAPARPSEAEREARLRRFAEGKPAVATGLVEIGRTDNSFDPEEFMKGARAAYEMIVMAFAEGNRQLLKDLLSPEVFEGFAHAISDREGRREIVEQSFVGISSAEIVEADQRAGLSQITVKFVSELISATRSAAGEVISGDPKRIKEVTDVWTFARESRSPDPNWRLVATQAAS